MLSAYKDNLHDYGAILLGFRAHGPLTKETDASLTSPSKKTKQATRNTKSGRSYVQRLFLTGSKENALSIFGDMRPVVSDEKEA